MARAKGYAQSAANKVAAAIAMVVERFILL
jgi:hypothetical protein